MDFLKKYFSWIITLFTFIVYLLTLAPSVVQIDSGELAAVQATLGIAHPTGYPLFTVLGYLFVNIPLPFTQIFLSNLLATIFCSAGIFVFTKNVFFLLSNSAVTVVSINAKQGKGKKKSTKVKTEESTPLSGFAVYTSVFAGSLLLAFSKTFWFQSTSVEVYSLHILLINIILYFVLLASFSKVSKLKEWLLVAFVLALGFTNHMTTLLIIPGLAYLYFTKESFSKKSAIKIAYMLALFFPVLIAVYMYLPIRASMDPILNWGNPDNFDRLIRHIGGNQYKVWLFSSMEAAGKQFKFFINNFPAEFGYAGLALILPGLFWSFKVFKKASWFLFITFIFTVVYSINYDIKDIETYFLLAFIVSAIWAAYGAAFIITKFKEKAPAAALGGIIAVVVVVNAGINFGKSDQSDVYIFEDYTKAVMNSVEDDAIIFGYQWDFWLSASYYYQFVEEVKPNVLVIDKELVRRSWYFDQMLTMEPEIFTGLEDEVENFRKLLVPFEEGGNFDANSLEKTFRAIFTKIMANQIGKRPIYFGPEIVDKEMRNGEFTLPEGYTIVPHMLMFKVVEDNKEYLPLGDPDFEIRYSEEDNYYTTSIETIIRKALVHRAIYERHNQKDERAQVYIKKLKEDFPDARLPAQVMDILNKK